MMAEGERTETEAGHFPCGSYTVSSVGKVAVSTLPASFPRVIMEVIGKVVISTLASAQDLDCPITELAVDFPGLELRARAVEGGAIIFVTPQEYSPSAAEQPGE